MDLCFPRPNAKFGIKSNDELSGTAQWQKDNENKKLKQAIKKISSVQQKKLDVWIKAHPTWMTNSEEQEEYLKLIKHCTDDLNENNKEQK